MQKGSTVEAAGMPLNAEGTWDQKEYSPLSDIPAGLEIQTLDFIAKLLRKKQTLDDMKLVEFIDEEGTAKTIHVRVTHHHCLFLNNFYVVHRAIIFNNKCKVDQWAMMSIAPQAYTWE